MVRYLAPLGVACLCLLTVAAVAQTQEPTTGTLIFNAVRPFVVELASVIISAAVLWLVGTVKAKFNIDIDAKHRDALQAALTNAAGLVINRVGGVAGAISLPAGSVELRRGVDYVVESAPDALKHFGITPEAAGQVLAEKLEAKIGVLATGAALPRQSGTIR